MSQDTALKSLDFVDAANTVMVDAQKLAEDVASEKKAAFDLASPLIDRLVSLQLIQDSERPIALRKLASHDGTMSVLGNLLTAMEEERVAARHKLAMVQGELTDEAGLAKSAGTGSSNGKPTKGHAVGAPRVLGEKRASDLALIRGLHLDIDI